MAHATLETGVATDRVNAAARAPNRRATFAQAVILAIALSLPVWAALIYFAVKLL